MYLLDTDILIDIMRGHATAIAWFASLTEVPSVPGFVVMKLIQDAKNTQRVRNALKLVAPLPVIWSTEADSYHLLDNLGLLDALIAACAVGREAMLCTFNVKHYRAIPSLSTAQPYTR
ncbi:PIN domain-containing protein [Dendronalium sp. ChiSLP03b]|uniref:PIN domain-containing protein n=1 Tax=Dendronalium sp. ChiSLP03b TaxID=3075381 RepID=UPI002AD30E84|nr:PIN domain-containing protein [Dendronalium sp. ChiSLP03b]MDZ8204719.1 VapC toxin family PIN domain ribonuclease [Dendronalium sp. ChiSLP03b]